MTYCYYESFETESGVLLSDSVHSIFKLIHEKH